jgi:hypothetical protein
MKDTIKNFVHYPKLSKAAINHLQSNSDPGRTLGRTEPPPRPARRRLPAGAGGRAPEAIEGGTRLRIGAAAPAAPIRGEPFSTRW